MGGDYTYKKFVSFVNEMYGETELPLHRPVFEGNERRYLLDCVDSNFVSSVGSRVTEFEHMIASFVGAKNGVATINGTAALHTALTLADVKPGDEVLTQALTFVATVNAVAYIGGQPVFIDVDKDTLGMSPSALRLWLENNTRFDGSRVYNKDTGARIVACVPMHTFGLPLRIVEISAICAEYGIVLIEDSAESLGSYVADKHTGTFGSFAAFSFNGNKIITTGGGGCLVTDDDVLFERAKHITTTAKQPHQFEFYHDEIGYNYRLPNLNAALGVAQMEVLDEIISIKSEIASRYRNFCSEESLKFIDPIEGTTSNFWLNAILLDDLSHRNDFLNYTNTVGVMTRPIWRLMSELPMYSAFQNDGLENSRWLVDRVVNLPSSVPASEFNRLSA